MKQKIVFWIAIAVILLIGIFPSWNYVCVQRQGVAIPKTSFHYIKDAGYHFLWNPPTYLVANPSKPSLRMEIDNLLVTEVRLNTRRLLAEYLIAIPLLGFLFTFTFSAKRHIQRNQQKTTSQKSQTGFLKNGLKPPAGSGFQTGKDFLAYLLRGLDKR
jgi:hypothetical protein